MIMTKPFIRAIWALIALDSGNYATAQRQAYIDYILSKEISGGGWALTGSSPDADITGMALQALAKYCSQKRVETAVVIPQRSFFCVFSPWKTGRKRGNAGKE